VISSGKLTCTGSAHAATRGARGALSFLSGANTQASGGVARARVAAGASLRCAVDLVGSAQVCRLQNITQRLQQVHVSAVAATVSHSCLMLNDMTSPGKQSAVHIHKSAMQPQQLHCQSLTCTGAVHTATGRACGAIYRVCGTNTQASSWIARAGVAAGASLRCAVDAVGSALVCRLQNRPAEDGLSVSLQ
jgi:hypothetical protein